MIKTCRVCGEAKHLDEFGSHMRNNKENKSNMCKECSREKQRKIRHDRKIVVLNHYGGKCTCCGEDRLEFLTIDHINGGGCEHRRSLGSKGVGSRFYKWIEDNFPEDLQVLCFNCNCAKGAYGYCPHEKELKLVQNC